ncbi:MAG: 16S rRNA (adenine(1518)-N(6)/adenine(1519)-N(6))-dimethyltransferase RsmA [Candidatus Krumholzibacteriia bacterium]
MSRSQLALLRAYGIRPLKRRGQNFLVDANLAHAIAADVLTIGREVLELGAGAGALTAPLLEAGARVTAVEIDRDLCRLLQGEFGGDPRLDLQQEDLTRLDWTRLLAQAGDRPVVAGNLPYLLTSKVLFALADHQQRVAGAVVMVQKEVADRLVASPGGRDYGVLAVILGSLFHVEISRTVPPSVFWPRPDVSSAVVRMSPAEAWPHAERKHFQTLVKTCFEQRRKQMATQLRDRFALDEGEIAALAAAVDFDPQARPEALPRATWRRLARALPPEGDA